MSNQIKVTYFLNEKESTITIDQRSKFYALKNIIFSNSKADPNDFDAYYNKKLMAQNEERVIKDIIGDNKTPLIYFKSKETIKQNGNSKKEDAGNRLKNKIIIENFPTAPELVQVLDSFLDKNDHPRKYETEHKGNWIQFSFSNSDIAYEFMKHLNLIKLDNNLYSKIKTTLLLDANKESVKREPYTNRHHNNSNILNSSIQSGKSIPVHKLLAKKNIAKNKQIINKFYENQSIVRISGPYMTYEDMRRKEDIENKKKWVSKYAFQNKVGKSAMIPISNYVRLTPSNPPVVYVFRPDEKKKWISDKGFLI